MSVHKGPSCVVEQSGTTTGDDPSACVGAKTAHRFRLDNTYINLIKYILKKSHQEAQFIV